MTSVGTARKIDQYHRFCLVRFAHWFWSLGKGGREFGDLVVDRSRLDRPGVLRATLTYAVAVVANLLFGVVASFALLLAYRGATGDEPARFFAIGLLIFLGMLAGVAVISSVIFIAASMHPRWFCRICAGVFLLTLALLPFTYGR